MKFQFTHPGRGATPPLLFFLCSYQRFNSRTPGGVRPSCSHSRWWLKSFNSRTPGGVRHIKGFRGVKYSGFQFTHPGRGATSIRPAYGSPLRRFNSRTPGGVRPQV